MSRTVAAGAVTAEGVSTTLAGAGRLTNTPPTSRLVLLVAEAIPARRRSTDDMTAAVIGDITKPIPSPSA